MKVVRVSGRGNMEKLTIAVIITIINCVITVASFVSNRKDKSNNDTKNDSYKWGQIDAKLSNIEKSLAKIEDRLENIDIEVDKKIDLAMQHHINEYHKEEK